MEALPPAPPRPVLNRNVAFLPIDVVTGIAATTLLVRPRSVTTHDLIWRAQRCVWGTYLAILQFGSMTLVFPPDLQIHLAHPSSYFARGRRHMLSNGLFLRFGKFIVAWDSPLTQFKSNSDDSGFRKAKHGITTFR